MDEWTRAGWRINDGCHVDRRKPVRVVIDVAAVDATSAVAAVVAAASAVTAGETSAATASGSRLGVIVIGENGFK